MLSNTYLICDSLQGGQSAGTYHAPGSGRKGTYSAENVRRLSMYKTIGESFGPVTLTYLSMQSSRLHYNRTQRQHFSTNNHAKLE